MEDKPLDKSAGPENSLFEEKLVHAASKSAAKPPIWARKSIKGNPRWADWLLFIGSLIYLITEIEFNMSLLEVAGSVRSDPADIDHLQVFGRAVSACGCLLLVLGVFARTGFHINSLKLRLFYIGVAVLAMIPQLLIFLQVTVGVNDSNWIFPISPTPEDFIIAALPMLGFAYGLLVGKGKNAFITIISLCMIIWPAMFLGQKMLIEQALIERTTWEERVNARYVLMLRAVLEDCTINLDDLELCDAAKEQDSVKSARIILGSIWMLSPDGIRQDMEDNRDKMVQSVASRGLWFPPKALYNEYVARVKKERDQFIAHFMDKYYRPYESASILFTSAVSGEKLGRESERAADEIDKEIDSGFRQYRAAVREYRTALSMGAMDIARKLAPYKRPLDLFCKYRDCPETKLNNKLLEEAKSRAEAEFMEATGGYTPDITTREGFLNALPTQIKLRDKIEEKIRTELNEPKFMLPANWIYDRDGFKRAVENFSRAEAVRKWREKFGEKLPPGLDIDAFLKASGLPPFPSLDDMLMSRDAFFKKMIIPRYAAALDKLIGDIEGEKELYANGQELAEQGKDYARAVYIPAISMVISLTVVILTLFRGWNVMTRHALARAMRHHRFPQKHVGWIRPIAQGAMMGLFVVAIFVMPYLMPNPYAAGGYHRYLAEAREKAPFTATFLDWAMHTQPMVYRLGEPIRVILNKAHGN
jgi:hypothetical protein